MKKSWPVLPLRAMSRSVAMQQPGSESMYVAEIITKGYEDVLGLGCHLGP